MIVPRNLQKEQFSLAYIHAVATVAECWLGKPAIDVDSVDVMIHGNVPGAPYEDPDIKVQAKCTSQKLSVVSGCYTFPLPVKNYNELRKTNVQQQRLLVVVLVPEVITSWLTHTPASTTIQYCGFWVSLRGQGSTTNTSTVNVSIPKANVFDAISLKNIMSKRAFGVYV